LEAYNVSLCILILFCPCNKLYNPHLMTWNFKTIFNNYSFIYNIYKETKSIRAITDNYPYLYFVTWN